jgi:hypothetical protein
MNKQEELILTKRIQTTMIGALYEFEKAFGYLWGHHKDDNEDLTNAENDFWDLWEETRNKILNNGNNQLRKAISEFKKSQSFCYKYQYKVNPPKKGNDQ